MKITRSELLMGREVQYPLTPELEENLTKLLEALNKFRAIYGQPMIVTSGYRPGHYNKNAGGAKKSAHLLCKAADFRDRDGKLAIFCLQNTKILEQCGLWCEDFAFTKGWVHFDIVPRKNRIFRPY